MLAKSITTELIKQLFDFQRKQTREIVKLVSKISNIEEDVKSVIEKLPGLDSKLCLEQLRGSIASLEKTIEDCISSNNTSRNMLEQTAIDLSRITAEQETLGDYLKEIKKLESQTTRIKSKKLEQFFKTSVPIKIVLIIVAIFAAIILSLLGLKQYILHFLKILL